MTTVEDTTTDASSAESYRDATIAASESDRAFASEIAVSVIEVIKAFNAVKGRLHGQNHPDGMDFSLVIKLAKEGPMRASDLSEQMCADPSTVSRQVANLVKSGLIERKADPKDGRASILVPTEAGLERVRQFIALRGQIFAPVIAHWSPDDRATFSRLMADFAAGLTSNLESVKNVASELIQHNALSTSQGRNA